MSPRRKTLTLAPISSLPPTPDPGMNLTAVEFRRGWPVLLAAALGTACGAAPIPFNSIGPFTKPLADEFGWGRGDISAGSWRAS